MLALGYPHEGSIWSDLHAFYHGESIVVHGITHTTPVWVPLLRVVDREAVAYKLVRLLFTSMTALASMLGFWPMFNSSFRVLVRRPFVLYLAVPGPGARTLTERDRAEAASRGLVVTCDAAGISCSGTYDDSRWQLSRPRVKELCKWALSAVARATPDVPGSSEVALRRS